MSLEQIDFSKTLSDDQVYDTIMSNYSELSKEWISHQWNWMNNIYWSFNDHYKHLIVISLIEKTLQFYDQMNIQYSFDEYYSKSFLQIEKFSIAELCEKLDLPKETVRRKVLELEKEGVINRIKKKILIDRKAFNFVKPNNQIKFSAKYIFLVSRALNKNKIYSKKLDPKIIEEIIKKRFSLCWRWFYRMQIPLIIGYHKFMQDLTTFHIWGTVAMNQVLNVSKELQNPNLNNMPLDYTATSKILINNVGMHSGVSAMSISEMTNIPRATIIRKCKFLIKNDLIKVNKQKQYELSTLNFKKILPYQSKVFKYKAKFIRKILNLLVIS
tara:strand:- start:614 stop:1594 length:981 start_codon:yes stop_codon:yes gene_type:complete